MGTMTEILAHFLSLHNALGAQVDAPDKEDFDEEHRHLWGKCREELTKRLIDLQKDENPNPAFVQEIADLLTYLKM